MERTIKFLDEHQFPIKRIVSSPLQRALRVAEMISRGNIQVTTFNGLLPWNLGDLQGKTNKLVKDSIQRLLDYPDLKAPHGESYRTFYNRWSGVLAKFMQYAIAKPDEVLLLTTHSRNINALQEIIDGEPIGDVKEITPEASVTLLAQTGLGDWSHDLIWEGK